MMLPVEERLAWYVTPESQVVRTPERESPLNPRIAQPPVRSQLRPFATFVNSCSKHSLHSVPAPRKTSNHYLLILCTPCALCGEHLFLPYPPIHSPVASVVPTSSANPTPPFATFVNFCSKYCPHSVPAPRKTSDHYLLILCAPCDFCDAHLFLPSPPSIRPSLQWFPLPAEPDPPLRHLR